MEVRTAREAIERSVSHNEIVYAEDTTANREHLTATCDDWVDAGDVIEYWTNDWRVHITVDESSF